jgi:hypothetical protein
MAFTKNIVTDYGCPIDGTSDCRPAFLAFRSAAQGLDAALTVPAHTYKFLFNAGPVSDAYIFEGIKSLVLSGSGATLSNGGVAGGGFELGSRGLFNDNIHHGRIAAARAADASRFTVGNYALIAAIDLQGAGYPLNPYIFEYVKISGISGAVISFTPSLINSYGTAFPNYEPGNAVNIDQGGPATIYAMPAAWDCDLEYDGITVSQPGIQTYANGRSIKFKTCVCTNSEGIVPSQNQVHKWDNCDFSPCTVEMDKLVSLFDAGNGTTVHQLKFQSSSIQMMTSTGGLTLAAGFNGTPKNAILDSVTSTVSLGPIANGRAESFYASNSTISSIQGLGVTLGDSWCMDDISRDIR